MAGFYIQNPLTTVFTPPASCSDLPWYYDSYLTEGDRIAQIGYYFTSHYSVESWTSCWPTSFFISSRWLDAYSPGLCPSGYTTAYMSLGADLGGLVDLVKTYAQCCPSGYTLEDTQMWQGLCTSSFTTPMTVTTIWGVSGPNPITVSRGVATRVRVIVEYDASDLSVFPAGYTPGLLTSVDGMNTATLPTSYNLDTIYPYTATSPTSSGSTISSYGSGPKVKLPVLLGVLIPLISIIVGGLWACIVYRRRRRHRTSVQQPTEVVLNRSGIGPNVTNSGSRPIASAVNESFSRPAEAISTMTEQIRHQSRVVRPVEPELNLKTPVVNTSQAILPTTDDPEWKQLEAEERRIQERKAQLRAERTKQTH